MMCFQTAKADTGNREYWVCACNFPYLVISSSRK